MQHELFDEGVAEGVRRGDPDAVGTVYVNLADRLLGYLIARVRDRATAEDLLGATFVELLHKGSTIRGGPAAIKVWLFRAAYFNAMDHLRKQQRRGEDLVDDLSVLEVEDRAVGPEEAAEVAEDVRTVREALRHLSEDQRHVLLLRYLGNLSAPEAADVLGKTEGAVRSLQHRGERALARLLGAPSGAPRPAPSPPAGAS